MKMCTSSCNSQGNFPDVKTGDVVMLKSGECYLVVSLRNSRHLISLRNGIAWSQISLWGSLRPRDVTKVEACFKITQA